MLLLVKDVAASGVRFERLSVLRERFKENLHMARRWRKEIFFLKYHIESIIVQKTKVPVSDISVRLSCQVSRERYFN